MTDTEYHFYSSDPKKVIKELGADILKEDLNKMLLIRNFEARAESAYQQGKIGGFFHSYSGQEAIQTACIRAMGVKNWYIATYRCHALALLLGAGTDEVMAEFYGKVTGNAMGRGGSMHLYTDRLLGGFAIVGGHTPVAAGAAFSLEYLGKKDEVALCFLGEGAVAQGAFHESLNMASLWNLPCIYVIENNQWGMGTAVNRAICVQPIAEKMASSYNMKSYTLDGMDYTNTYAAFKHIHEETLQTRRPVLVEAVTQRFKGHSISDPGFYRTKEELEKAKQRDPIILLKNYLIESNMLTEDEFKEMNKQNIEIVKKSMEFAEKSPAPDPLTLEEGVFAPEDENIMGY
ncbi:MAG: pyruvate dehydrogenase (acetyl-transferring) E1 component subunit alpha [Chlamydiota bacterium]|jgi:pyruvate dehydrogenase E1 component alpha subunit